MSPLAPTQLRAIAALLSEQSHPAAAKAAKVSGRTLRRWLKQPLFAAELQSAQSAVKEKLMERVDLGAAAADAAFRRAIAQLKEGSAAAVETLRTLATTAEKDSTRTFAAAEFLRATFRALEQMDMLDRLRALEARLTNPHQSTPNSEPIHNDRPENPRAPEPAGKTS